MLKKFFLGVMGFSLLMLGVAKASTLNDGFESASLLGWDAGGQVGVQSDVVYYGDYAGYIGTVDFDENDLNDYTGQPGTTGYTNNYLSLNIDVTGLDAISFYYNFYTWDYAPYDNPGFEIQINGNPVLSLSAADVDTGSGLDSTGWQLFYYDLTNYTGTNLNLTIYAGNTGNSYIQSWAYVDAVPLGAPVPIPGAFYLLGSSLLGMIGIGRKKTLSSLKGIIY